MMDEEWCDNCDSFVEEGNYVERGHQKEECEVCGLIVCDRCALINADCLCPSCAALEED